MADAKHVKILKKGVEEWNRWWRANEWDWPDLSEANLSKVDLAKADLSGANLSKADLSGADLTEANLSKADLIGANLSGANLSKADLSGAKLGEANLSKADLSGADLTEANLSKADLSGANLIEANLSKAGVSEADLTGANLRMANLFATNLGESNLGKASLVDANLRRAILRRASLREADLWRANLTEADLAGTDLAGAGCWHTIFADVFLHLAAGLDTVIHTGPSTIGLDTFLASNGKIPEAFLRGAGVPDPFIQYAASLARTAIEFYSCFISYSHANKVFAHRLHDALQGRGIRCWLDEKQLLPGDHIHREVDEAVRLWDKVLLCCSKDSLNSWWVDKEISKALKREEQLWKERGKQVLAIIPLNLDGYMFEPQWQDWKKQHLTDRVAPDFKGWEMDDAKFEARLHLPAPRAGVTCPRHQPPVGYGSVLGPLDCGREEGEALLVTTASGSMPPAARRVWGCGP
jgi:uncharacterized protein YjbI with pentapeptide repeats